MSRVFTAFVRSIDLPLAQELFPSLWQELALALRRELSRRGLWLAPPSYLGVLGSVSWEAPEDAAAGRSTPFEELVADCYSFIFVDRLRSLAAQLQSKPNIDGLVLLNVRHFVSERQQDHDPIGSRVFELVSEAIEQALAAGELELLSGEERLGNGSLLAAPGAGRLTSGRDVLRAATARWVDALLPELIEARGRRLEEVVGELRRRIRELSGAGIVAFRFKDLVNPLKVDARERWGALLDLAQGERATELAEGRYRVVRFTRPELAFLDDEDQLRLARRIEGALGELEVDPRTRGYLLKLWSYAAAAGSALDGPPLHSSHRRIGEALGIPRERLPALVAQLAEVASRCQEELFRPIVESRSHHDQRTLA